MWRLAFFLAIGCGGDDPPGGTAPETSDTGTPPPPDPVRVDGAPQGQYLVGLSVAPIGGLIVPFQADVETFDLGDGPVFTRFDLRAVGSGDSLSEVLVSASDIAIAEGAFTADLPEFVVPAAYSVTSSDVAVKATLHAESATEAGFCGAVEGSLVTFDIDLEGSTFGAIPWADRAAGAPGSCEAPPSEIPRIATCPPVVAEANVGFPSGGQLRDFEVVLPAQYDPAVAWPLVFVFHGFGGTPSDMLDGTGLAAYADSTGSILVAPQALDSGGSALFDAFGPPATNLDLVLFDDLLTCTSESFHVDPQRIHATGMSNGGLMTGYLAAMRSDVLASVAPLSGGMGVEPIDTGYAMPALVVWGGAADVAFQQDFDLLATQMIADFRTNGQFVVACDHGLGHTLEASFWTWVMPFLADHPRNLASEPYAAGLPGVFPGYCVISP